MTCIRIIAYFSYTKRMKSALYYAAYSLRVTLQNASIDSMWSWKAQWVPFASMVFLRRLMGGIMDPAFAQIFAYGKCLCIMHNATTRRVRSEPLYRPKCGSKCDILRKDVPFLGCQRCSRKFFHVKLSKMKF